MKTRVHRLDKPQLTDYRRHGYVILEIRVYHGLDHLSPSIEFRIKPDYDFQKEIFSWARDGALDYPNQQFSIKFTGADNVKKALIKFFELKNEYLRVRNKELYSDLESLEKECDAALPKTEIAKSPEIEPIVIPIDPTTAIDSDQKKIVYKYLAENQTIAVFKQYVAYPCGEFFFELNKSIVKISNPTVTATSAASYQYSVFTKTCGLYIFESYDKKLKNIDYKNAIKADTPILIRNTDTFFVFGRQKNRWKKRKLALHKESIELIKKNLPFEFDKLVFNTSKLIRKKYAFLLPLLINAHDGFEAYFKNNLLGSGTFAETYNVPGALVPTTDGQSLAYVAYPADQPKALKIIDINKRSDIKKIKHEYQIMQAAEGINPHPPTFDSQFSSAYLLQDLIKNREYSFLIDDVLARKISLTLALFYFHNFLKAVIELHKRNIVHRDLKPDNLILDDKTGKVTIIDFGLSVFTHELENAESAGTPLYVAPEVAAEEEQDHRVDVFSAGFIGLQTLLCIELYNRIGQLSSTELIEERNQIYINNFIPDFHFRPEVKKEFGNHYNLFKTAMMSLIQSRPENRNLNTAYESIGTIVTALSTPLAPVVISVTEKENPTLNSIETLPIVTEVNDNHDEGKEEKQSIVILPAGQESKSNSENEAEPDPVPTTLPKRPRSGSQSIAAAHPVVSQALPPPPPPPPAPNRHHAANRATLPEKSPQKEPSFLDNLINKLKKLARNPWGRLLIGTVMFAITAALIVGVVVSMGGLGVVLGALGTAGVALCSAQLYAVFASVAVLSVPFDGEVEMKKIKKTTADINKNENNILGSDLKIHSRMNSRPEIQSAPVIRSVSQPSVVPVMLTPTLKAGSQSLPPRRFSNN